MGDREAVAYDAVRSLCTGPYPPSVRDIAERLDWPVSTTHRVLTRLRDRGLITWETGHFRTIRLPA